MSRGRPGQGPKGNRRSTLMKRGTRSRYAQQSLPQLSLSTFDNSECPVRMAVAFEQSLMQPVKMQAGIENMKNIFLECVWYWELRRLGYNAVLTMVVLAMWLYHHPSLSTFKWQTAEGLLLIAFVANVLYCAAYLADIFVKMSKYQRVWKEGRRAIFAVGTILAAAIFCITRD